MYVTPTELKAFAQASDSLSDDGWSQLCASASLAFDREAGLADGFFKIADNAASERVFFGSGTRYMRLPPFVGEIAVVSDTDGLEVPDYSIEDNYLVSRKIDYPAFNYLYGRNVYDYAKFLPFVKYRVTARWGFAEIPEDVKQAVIALALWMWREQTDPNFSVVSNTENTGAEKPPVFIDTAKAYREKYLEIAFG